MAEVCTATKKNGKPCSAATLPDSLFCRMHEPRLAEQRLAFQRKGGRSRASPPRIAVEEVDFTDPANIPVAISRLWTMELRRVEKVGYASASLKPFLSLLELALKYHDVRKTPGGTFNVNVLREGDNLVNLFDRSSVMAFAQRLREQDRQNRPILDSKGMVIEAPSVGAEACLDS